MHKDESLINFSVGVNRESESPSLSDVLERTDLLIFAKKDFERTRFTYSCSYCKGRLI